MPDSQDTSHAEQVQATNTDPTHRLRRILFVCNMGRIRKDLEARLALAEPAVTPLGLLMLIPDPPPPCTAPQLAVY
jgi:hypothetical protein